MKKALILITVIAVLTSAICYTTGIFEKNTANGKDSVNVAISDTVELKDVIVSGVASGAIMGYDSLKDLKMRSDLVIVGNVIKTEQVTELSFGSLITVVEKLKGKSENEILVYELVGDNILETGKEYVLFLHKHDDGKENTYTITGVAQGSFEKMNNGKLFNSDDKMKNDLEKIKKGKKDKSDLDALIEYSKE